MTGPIGSYGAGMNYIQNRVGSYGTGMSVMQNQAGRTGVGMNVMQNQAGRTGTGMDAVQNRAGGIGAGMYGMQEPAVNKTMIRTEEQAQKAGLSDTEIRALKRNGTMQCETCDNRKYQDVSNESVSFKAAAHVSPGSAGAAVRAHEQEHVANAYDKAKKGDGKVISAGVTIKTAVCPECGRTYVSGGETRTNIKYNKDKYGQNSRAQDAAMIPGMNLDMLV